MSKNLSVHVFSHSATRLTKLEDIFLDRPGISVTRKLLTDKTRDVIGDSDSAPDVMVLDLGPAWEADLHQFASGTRTGSKPALVVIGNNEAPEMMRRAMQAGARDFFTSPFDEEELIESVNQVGAEVRLAQRYDQGKITAVINGKGGGGASFIASGLATTLAFAPKKTIGKSVVALDLDLQFGNLPVYFDMPVNDNLANAINGAASLDRVALDGLMQHHSSGVKVLASMPEEIRGTSALSASDTQTLISFIAANHDHVIVDLPRTLNNHVAGALELVDEVIVVTQQSIPFVRDTRYLMNLIRGMGVSINAVKLLINRYQKSDIRMQDVQDAFPDIDIYTVPNDHKRAIFSVNNGIPVPVKWPRSTISKSLQSMSGKLWPENKK